MSDKGSRDPHSPMNNVNWVLGIVVALIALAIVLAGIVNTPALEVVASIPGNIGAIVNRAGVKGISWPWSGGCVHHPLMRAEDAALYCAGKKGLIIPLPGQNQNAVGNISGGNARVSLDTAVRQYQFGNWDGANGSCSLAQTAYSQAVSEGDMAVQAQAEVLVRECAAALSALQGMQACDPLSDSLTCIMYSEEVLKRNPASRQAADIRELSFRSQEWEGLRQQASQLAYDGGQDNWSALWPPVRRQQVIDLLWKRRFSIVDGIDIGMFRSSDDSVRIALIDVPSHVPAGATEPKAAAPIEFTLPLGVLSELMGKRVDDFDPKIYEGWDRIHQLTNIPGGYLQPAGPQQIPPPPASLTLDLNPSPTQVPAAPVESAPGSAASTYCVPNTVVPAEWPVFVFDPGTGFPTEVTGSVSAVGATLTGDFVGEGDKTLCKTNLEGVNVWPGPLYGWTR